MKGILDAVNQMTQLVGQNRLELLVFRLLSKQRFGINVFKVKEILLCPKLAVIPNLHPFVKGIANVRGNTISIIDLNLAIGGAPTEDSENSFVIISEFNRSVQGFLVDSVERIVNINWDKVLPPPDGIGNSNYLTAVTEIDNELVQMLDVEAILFEIAPMVKETDNAKFNDTEALLENSSNAKTVVVVDDSNVARNQIKKSVESLGFDVILCHDGREALQLLNDTAKQENIYEKIALVVSDIEMPSMDGYTLTSEIRKSPELKKLKVVLHSSLSGEFNEIMVERVGANAFIAKFVPDEFVSALIEAINKTE